MTNSLRTKTDFSNNRQVIQYPRTNTVLSGATTFGVPFSALTTGPDPSNSGISETLTSTTATFTGTTGSTTYTFDDSRLELGVSVLSAWTSSNSGETQYTYNVFTGNNSTVIDGNSVNLDYSGVNYSLYVSTIEEVSPGNYTGNTSFFNSPTILSADTLDFTSRTIWASIPGILEADTIILNGSLSACTGTIFATSFSGCSPMDLYGVMTLDDGNAVVHGDLTVLGNFTISGGTKVEMHTETIVAEDNNIELNYNGNHTTAIGGGLTVLSGLSDGSNSVFETDSDGYWNVTPGILTKEYTPSGTTDIYGKVGETTWDDNYIYIKTNIGWGRTILNNF